MSHTLITARRAFFALAMLSALALPAPAQAEVRLGRESDGNYRIKVMTWWEIPFRSVVRQQYDYSCGSAAVATLLTYHYDRPTSESDVFAEMWRTGDQDTIRKVGFSMLEMKAYLDGIGYRTEGVRLTVEQLEAIRRPLIVLITPRGYSHFVVVKGVRDGQVLVGDSVLGLKQYPLEDFAKIWNEIALVVMEQPGDRESPQFNLAGDWGPWSVAPIDQGDARLRLAAGDVTAHLPPIYQITPEFILDVRVGTVR